MDLTRDQLNRTLLRRQLLLERPSMKPVEAVRRVTAVQAQEPASVYLALHNRIASFDPASLDTAYESGDLVRSIQVRITLHTVTAADYPWFHAAMEKNLRASRLNDRRFTESGLTAADADAALPEFLSFMAEPRDPAAIDAWITDRFGRPVERLWWAWRTHAPVVRHPGESAWRFRTGGSFRAGPVEAGPIDHTDALAHLFARYLEGFGPATAQDFGLFAMQRKPAWTAAIEQLGDRLVTHRGPKGETLYDLPDGELATGDEEAPPRLLGMWDNVLLAHVDRSRVIPDEYRSVVIRRNGDTLPTLLVNGRVAGVWRALPEGIEATSFRKLPKQTWNALAAEAAPLWALVRSRDPRIYSRYHHWWSELPEGESRLLS